MHGERVAALYRRACEHLALARARFYPAYLVDRLEQITGDAHQAIYQHSEFGIGRLARLFSRDFPARRARPRGFRLDRRGPVRGADARRSACSCISGPS